MMNPVHWVTLPALALLAGLAAPVSSARASVYFVTIGGTVPTASFTLIGVPNVDRVTYLGPLTGQLNATGPSGGPFSVVLPSLPSPGAYDFFAFYGGTSSEIFEAVYTLAAGNPGPTVTVPTLVVVKLVTRPSRKRISVSIDHGDPIQAVSPSSDLSLFGLAPGAHIVTVFEDGVAKDFPVQVAAIAEPASLSLVALAAAAALRLRRRPVKQNLGHPATNVMSPRGTRSFLPAETP